MFKLSTEQHTAVINNTHIGGQPGEWPTVLCGSIFFAGHKIVKDPEAGIFDEQAALELLKTEGRLADEYGLGRMVDVIGETGTALKSYVKFVLENTDCPLLVDSSSVRALLDAFQYFAGSQVMERLVYNSIDPRH
ncbi:MAG: tetrahydromethanopterin S-methyltransferase subunit H, partial [Clostridia bacterium]|nr:tetrahydromethanopterin S-methyltransferase subunit H [Clostridia bacterium]